MNPRILKKLSKRADAIVGRLMPELSRFVTDDGSIDCAYRMDRKHCYRTKNGVVRSIFEALDGTVGYGCMSGYYEPEWDEKDAYSHLVDWLAMQHSSVVPDGDYFQMVCTIRLRTPADVFRAASHLPESPQGDLK